ncbi:MAG: agglutinin biogenesis protein MshI [Burkholderiales bacterium]|nr:agglutinin biogenesis protein MshI [Burkholderiales bacterium]
MRSPFLRRRARQADWLAVAVHDDRIELALVARGTQGCALLQCQSHAYDGSPVEALGRVRRALGPTHWMCSNLLEAGGYQMQLTEAPAVPEAEMREAVRWKLTELIDYPVDQATVDVVHVRGDVRNGARAQYVYAVSARNTEVAARMRLFHDAGFPLHAIDVPEMAQRNVARLFEQPDRGLALLCVNQRSGLLTITRDGELYLARRTDVGLSQLVDASGEVRTQALDRLVLELQRSLDHFERQFGHVVVSRLLVTPVPALLPRLQSNLDVPVEPLKLDDALDLSAVPELADPARQHACVHIIGAAMRGEAGK